MSGPEAEVLTDQARHASDVGDGRGQGLHVALRAQHVARAIEPHHVARIGQPV